MNFVILVGRIARDPDLRRTGNGNAITNFTLAISESKENTNFIDCRAFKQNAENLANYKRKGDLIAVSGKIKKDVWRDQNGTTQSRTYVIANFIEYLANAKANEGNQQPQPQPQQTFEQQPSFNNNQFDINGWEMEDDDMQF